MTKEKLEVTAARRLKCIVFTVADCPPLRRWAKHDWDVYEPVRGQSCWRLVTAGSRPELERMFLEWQRSQMPRWLQWIIRNSCRVWPHSYERTSSETTLPDGVIVEGFYCSRCGDEKTKYWPRI